MDSNAFVKPTLPPAMVDRAAYNQSMHHLPLHELGSITDYGCANGVMLKHLSRAVPHAITIGVDRDPEQINASFSEPGHIDHLFPDMRGAAWTSRVAQGKSLLILSSVLHEVWSECRDAEDVNDWWQCLEQFNFDYIAIRDFGVTEQLHGVLTPGPYLSRAFAKYPGLLLDHTGLYGSSYRMAAFAHFLLKYPYADNWERERREDYTKVTVEDLLALTTFSGRYEIIHQQRTVTKHFVERCKADLNIDVNFTTHIELVLKRRG
jgi:hypothetical protein